MSYDKRTTLSMKSVVKLERAQLKILNKNLSYLNEHNLTFSQFKVLEVLFHKGDLNVSSITKLTMSTPGNITVVLKNLKRDGLIKSLTQKDDKRSYIYSITNEGEKIIKNVFPEHSNNLKEIFNCLTISELETFFDLLNKIYKNN